MDDKKKKIFVLFIGALAIINLLVLNFVWIRDRGESFIFKKQEDKLPSTAQSSETLPSEECFLPCQAYIDQKIGEAVADLGSQGLVAKTIVQTTQPSGSKVIYITIGGSSSTNSTSWEDIAGTDFYFDLSDYPQAMSIRWEISLRSFLAGNKVYARLYDVTNKRAVDFSELWSDSSTSELKRSQDLSIWRGNNLYRVQAKSSAGSDAYLDSPRLRIILE